MNYKYIIIFFFLFSCVPVKKDTSIVFSQNYINSGFAIVFNEDLHLKKIVSKRVDERSLNILQRNLKKNTKVKITNNINGKSIIATVINKGKYPYFYNAVISKRIAKELELNIDEPYIQILEINENSTFIASKAKTYDEEREVAEKAPVEEIGIKDLNTSKNNENTKITKSSFKYVIKIADFYFLNSAKTLSDRIKNELTIKHVKINEISTTKFRVYLGPFDNLIDLRSNFEKILDLNFENIEIIKL